MSNVSREVDNESAKIEFIKMLGRCEGQVKAACASSGISRATYYNWRKSDPDFGGRCDLVISAQKERERELRKAPVPVPCSQVADQPEADGIEVAVPVVEAERYRGPSAAELATRHEEFLRRSMQEAGLWETAFAPQIRAAAKLHASIEILFSRLDRYEPIQTELSREGNPRLVANPVHEMLRRQADTYTGILKSLGLNLESKAKPREEDTMGEFLNILKNDG